MGKRFACHKISEGAAQAEAIISKDRIMFYQVRPEDGVMTEKDHCLEGQVIAGKVLLFPGGKGSSVVQQDGLYHLDRFHNMPACRTPTPCWSPARSSWRSPWSTACRRNSTTLSKTATSSASTLMRGLSKFSKSIKEVPDAVSCIWDFCFLLTF